MDSTATEALFRQKWLLKSSVEHSDHIDWLTVYNRILRTLIAKGLFYCILHRLLQYTVLDQGKWRGRFWSLLPGNLCVTGCTGEQQKATPQKIQGWSSRKFICHTWEQISQRGDQFPMPMYVQEAFENCSP